MEPKKIFLHGDDYLHVIWSDKTEDKIRLLDLRKFCPCAVCQAEREHPSDWSHVFFTGDELKIKELNSIGKYAIGIVWLDGHNTGIYEFGYLHNLASGEK